MSDGGPDGGGRAEPPTASGLRATLERVRTSPSRRRVATNTAVLVGLVVAAVHPIGLLLGGALTALPQRRLVAGVLGGLGFGVVALVAFGTLLALQGAFATAVQTGEILGVTVAAGLGLPLLGSLVRGVV